MGGRLDGIAPHEPPGVDRRAVRRLSAVVVQVTKDGLSFQMVCCDYKLLFAFLHQWIYANYWAWLRRALNFAIRRSVCASYLPRLGFILARCPAQWFLATLSLPEFRLAS